MVKILFVVKRNYMKTMASKKNNMTNIQIIMNLVVKITNKSIFCQDE